MADKQKKYDFLKQKQENLGIYVHWPFCEAKCPYCDFNSHVKSNKSGSFAEHLTAIITALHEAKELTSNSSQVASIFFGGGTPSIMPTSFVEQIIECIYRLWKMNDNIEITLEANPSSSERQKFQIYQKAGVNRLSIGVQSLNDQGLKSLGRLHSALDGEKAIDMARNIFPAYSFDLIYNRISQKLSDWQNELEYALKLAGTHVSLYELTIEPGTLFGKMLQRGTLKPNNEETSEKFFLTTYDICKNHGFNAYEISNFSRNEAVCKHNLNYWRSGDYIGAGAGAWGRIWQMNQQKSLQRLEIKNLKKPAKFLQRSLDNRNIADVCLIDTQACVEEFIMMGLRLREGICLSTLDEVFGYTLPFDYCRNLCDTGFARIVDKKLALSKKALLLCNYFIGDIIGACIKNTPQKQQYVR